MYWKNFKLILLLFLIVTASACKKETLTEDDLGANHTLVSIPASLEQDPVKQDSINKYIVVIGSSTAAGYGASVRDSCWVARLRNRLVTDNKKVKVINLGVGGYTTFQLMPTPGSNAIPIIARPAADTNKNVTAALKYRPALVIINLPSNDITNNFRDEEIIKNYRAIIRVIASSKAEYIITGCQPINYAAADKRMRLKILTDKLVKEFPNNIDNYLQKLSTKTFSILKFYSAGDGTHLNDNGHKLVYQSVFNFPIFKSVAGYN